MKIIPYDEPETLRRFLTDQEWGYSTSNGRIMAVFCPLCAATVSLPTESISGWSPRAHHIDFHVNQSKYMMQHLNRITELERLVKEQG